MDDELEIVAIAIEATLQSVRVSDEPIGGEEALRMLDERLRDDGIDLDLANAFAWGK